MNGNPPGGKLRVDKWLWAARFYKSRSLASQAVEAGQVRLNDQRVKPGREIRVGDRLWLRTDSGEWAGVVQALSDRRGPADIARGLYLEDEESRRRREEDAAGRATAPNPSGTLHGRPTKKAGRQIRRFTDPG